MSRGINKQGRRRMNRRAPIVGDSATRRQHSTRLPSIDELKSAAMGRWPEIFHDAAGVPHELLDGRGHPCIRCGGTDRFAAFNDVAQRGSVQCRSCFNRSTDPRPGDGIATLRWLLGCDTSTACRWLAGWLGLTHRAESRPQAPLRRSVRLQVTSGIDDHFGRFAEDCHRAMQSAWWMWLEHALSLPVAQLRRLRVGWSMQNRATTWPMVDHDENVIGIRLRCVETGKKWSVSGGKAGLFVPSDLRAGIDRLFVTEGPTDCAALASIGFDSIGRPSCSGAVEYTAKLVRRLPKAVVLPLTDEAKKRFILFVNAHGRETIEHEDALAAAWSKLEGYALRFALVDHLVRWAAGDAGCDHAGPVGIASIEVGIELSRWFAAEAQRVYDRIGVTTNGERKTGDRHHERLAEWIASRGRSATEREIRRGPQRYRGEDGADHCETDCNALIQAGRARWETGRRTRQCRHALTRENTRAKGSR